MVIKDSNISELNNSLILPPWFLSLDYRWVRHPRGFSIVQIIDFLLCLLSWEHVFRRILYRRTAMLVHAIDVSILVIISNNQLCLLLLVSNHLIYGNQQSCTIVIRATWGRAIFNVIALFSLNQLLNFVLENTVHMDQYFYFIAETFSIEHFLKA